MSYYVQIIYVKRLQLRKYTNIIIISNNIKTITILELVGYIVNMMYVFILMPK